MGHQVNLCRFLYGVLPTSRTLCVCWGFPLSYPRRKRFDFFLPSNGGTFESRSFLSQWWDMLVPRRIYRFKPFEKPKSFLLATSLKLWEKFRSV